MLSLLSQSPTNRVRPVMIERGEVDPALSTAQAIADVFGVTNTTATVLNSTALREVVRVGCSRRHGRCRRTLETD